MELKTPRDLAIKARMLGKKTVSYSQFSRYKTCPKSWKLSYIDKHREFDPSIFLIFGTAFHETLQTYLDTMYKESAVKANELDVNKILMESMKREYKAVVEDCGEDFSTPAELTTAIQKNPGILDDRITKLGADLDGFYNRNDLLEFPPWYLVVYSLNTL